MLAQRPVLHRQMMVERQAIELSSRAIIAARRQRPIHEVSWRCVAELAIDADLFNFEKHRAGFPRVARIARPTDQIGRLHQLRRFVPTPGR